jgi:OFA family oxalate/formate antiporter-like MFS transporter
VNFANITHQRPRIFFGWWTVSLAGFMHSLNSSAYNKGFVVFLLPVSEGLGVSRAATSLVFSLSRSEGGPVGPIAGWLIDRFGPKPVLFIGIILSGTGFLLLSQAHNIWTFGLVYLAMITVGSDLAFSNSLSALINHWFHRRRALALSSYHSISSLGPAILVPLLALLIASQGWRTASMVAGLTILGIVLPLSFLIRSTPESVGMLPDGGPPESSSNRLNPGTRKNISTRETQLADFEMREALRTPSYWLLLTGSILRLTAKAGVMLHIIPIMVWKGIDEQTGAFIFGFLLFLGVPLSLFFGWLADTLPKNLVLFISAVSGTIAFFLLATPLSSIWIIYLFVFLFAIAETSGSNNWATFGDYFGRKAYGRLRGITQLASSPGVFLAPVFAGWWFDRVESYSLPIWVFTIFFGLGALTFALMRKPNVVPKAEESAVSATA